MYIVISTCMNFSNLECHGLIGNSAWGQDDRNYLPCHMDSYAFFKPEILAIYWCVGSWMSVTTVNDRKHGAFTCVAFIESSMALSVFELPLPNNYYA